MVGLFGDGGRSPKYERRGLAEALMIMQDRSTRTMATPSVFASSGELPIFSWQGADGIWYPHSVIRGFDTYWTCPANYAFVQRHADGSVTVHYIGIAENLRHRLAGHEKLVSAILAGANELHVHLLAQTDSERRRVEKTLIEGHAPSLNIQHNSRRSALGIFCD